MDKMKKKEAEGNVEGAGSEWHGTWDRG
jgi:hypothetical protein